MNTIYDLVVSILGTPQTEHQTTVVFIVSGILFLFVGYQFWMLIVRLFKFK